MKSYRIISGTWTDREKTKAALFIEETGGDKFYYGFDENDKAPVNLALKKLLKKDSSQVSESAGIQMLDGKIPLHPGMAVYKGELVWIEYEKAKIRQRIRGRINELYSGYEIAMSERNAVYAKNRKRKIENLLELEKDPDIGADVLEAEDA
jgi:hypothetical protein